MNDKSIADFTATRYNNTGLTSINLKNEGSTSIAAFPAVSSVVETTVTDLVVVNGFTGSDIAKLSALTSLTFNDIAAMPALHIAVKGNSSVTGSLKKLCVLKLTEIKIKYIHIGLHI